MKKIGLFTYYRSNYGAALQAYALKAFIESTFNNVNVNIVDFYKKRGYPIFEFCSNSFLKGIFKFFLVLSHYFEIRRRNKRHILYNENFLEQKRYDFSSDNNFNLIPSFDIYLTGSDQVFNIRHNEYKQLFFQQFQIKNGIKVAYAPSFGQSEFSDTDKLKIKSLTQSFDYLSCRENDGAAMLSEMHGKVVPCVIDPTLLLTSDQWAVMMNAPKTDEKYLLVYDLNGGVPMLNIAKKVAAEKGLKIYCISRHPDICFIYKGIDKVIYDAGPREFVGYFSQAAYIITDSFHGTSFSIIFKKDFNTYVALPNASQRIKSLLQICGLLDRIIENDILINYCDNCFANFDNQAFNRYRNLSILYISSFIQNN